MSYLNLLLRTPVTLITLIVCIIVYILQNRDPIVTQKYSYHYFSVKQGQYYRLLTGGFLHGSPWHILMNMYSLYNLGTWLELSFGSVRFAIVLFGGVILGNLFCLMMNVYSSIGLSGGLYALMFFYFALLFSYSNVSIVSLVRNNIANIMINFLPGVAWQAHLGGAAFGMIMAFLFRFI